MDQRRRESQSKLEASARLRDDGVVIYSQNGEPPIENEEWELHNIKTQLASCGASHSDADKFLDDLRLHGVAELRLRLTPMDFIGS
jgi:hypothetical protein